MQFFYITFTSAVGKFHFFCRQFCLLPVGRLRRVPYCHSQKQPRSALFLFFFYPLSHKCGGINPLFLSAVLLTAGGTAMPCPLLSLAKTAALCAVLIFLLSPLAQVRWE